MRYPCWLLAAGCWLLAAGCWLLAAARGDYVDVMSLKKSLCTIKTKLF
jgi:hypothetical protein